MRSGNICLYRYNAISVYTCTQKSELRPANSRATRKINLKTQLCASCQSARGHINSIFVYQMETIFTRERNGTIKTEHLEVRGTAFKASNPSLRIAGILTRRTSGMCRSVVTLHCYRSHLAETTTRSWGLRHVAHGTYGLPAGCRSYYLQDSQLPARRKQQRYRISIGVRALLSHQRYVSVFRDASSTYSDMFALRGRFGCDRSFSSKSGARTRP